MEAPKEDPSLVLFLRKTAKETLDLLPTQNKAVFNKGSETNQSAAIFTNAGKVIRNSSMNLRNKIKKNIFFFIFNKEGIGLLLLLRISLQVKQEQFSSVFNQ